jgi:Zn-dependent protease
MRNINPNKVYFSNIEKADLLKAWLATSIAFGIFFLSEGGYQDLSLPGFVFITIIAAITAGAGFLLHELAHKYTAHHFGVHSEFRSHDTMLILSIIIAFLGVIFAAPGAVYMFGNVSKRENGIISAAGPLANIVLSVAFLVLLVSSAQDTLLHSIGAYGLFINAFLAVFNMIPFADFDGAKIFRWNKTVYFTMVLVSAILVVSSFILIESLKF